MKRFFVFLTSLLALCSSGLFLARPAQAGSIFFTATDLTDLVLGQDLWQYTYDPQGFTFATNDAFEVLSTARSTRTCRTRRRRRPIGISFPYNRISASLLMV